MSDGDIQFDTDQQSYSSTGASNSYYSQAGFGQQSEATGMAGWLIRKGIISNENQAKAILLGVVLLNFILAGVVIYYFILK